MGKQSRIGEKMEITILNVGPVCTNCYIVNREGSKSCLVIDPGEDAEKIAGQIKKNGFDCEGILLTHGHFDHITGVSGLLSLVGGKVYACEEEREVLSSPQINASVMMGYETALEPEVWLRDGQILDVAGITFRVIHTPGHTRGSCCYYAAQDKVLFSGDTVFMESVGRTDFPTGNERELLDSVRNKILTLPDDVTIYPGHGPKTNVRYEAVNNPYA